MNDHTFWDVTPNTVAEIYGCLEQHASSDCKSSVTSKPRAFLILIKCWNLTTKLTWIKPGTDAGIKDPRE
jgi:hypothetical protein